MWMAYTILHLFSIRCKSLDRASRNSSLNIVDIVSTTTYIVFIVVFANMQYKTFNKMILKDYVPTVPILHHREVNF